jgi:hypothetical protein
MRQYGRKNKSDSSSDTWASWSAVCCAPTKKRIAIAKAG